ncbi:MAG: hypothetical protein KAI24_24790, partial [Planctomycetes bacterium]|nr:hypothetical protein [Planctomycetota bacterium]
LGALAAALALAAAAPTQQAIYALLDDPSGNPVQGATGWLTEERRWQLQALPSFVPPSGEPRPLVWPTATSDRRGVLRFGDDRWRPGAGSGLATTAEGLGALLPRLLAGRPQRVTLQPMAAVSTATGSERFTLHARARLVDGSRVVLPPQTGAQVRLPAGDYECWAHSEDGWTWQRLVLRAGGRAELRFDGAVQRVRLPADAYVHPDGWPTLALRGANDAADLVLRGTALAAPLVTWTGQRVTPAMVLPGPPTAEPLSWPPPREVATAAIDGGVAGATWFGLLRQPSGAWLLLARARADDGGRVQLPDDPGGDSWLLCTGEHAPFAVPWASTARLAERRPDRGVALVVAARDQTGLPVADLVCVFEPDGMPAAAVMARSDAVGTARFGRQLAPGVLTVVDPRYGNQRIELADIPTDPLNLIVDPGAVCEGTATFADGEADATIVVTLRDPRGQLRPAERVRAVRPGEPFTFAGLPEQTDLLLFATATRAGRTWSARLVVRSGDDEVRLVLADEDPELGR